MTGLARTFAAPRIVARTDGCCRESSKFGKKGSKKWRAPVRYLGPDFMEREVHAM